MTWIIISLSGIVGEVNEEGERGWLMSAVCRKGDQKDRIL